MIRRPPRSTRTDTLFPYTTLFRSYSPQPVPVIEIIRSLIHPYFEFRAKDPVGWDYWIQLLQKENGTELYDRVLRSEEHTSELQSLMRISYAVFCLQKKTHKTKYIHHKLI